MRTVLITGASRGIGLGLVREFLSTAGTRVIATARQPESAPQLAAILKAMIYLVWCFSCVLLLRGSGTPYHSWALTD
jgi:NAD(P)-dependent dehydrogenase (short-subunit alcohol dehydrogenase family)